MKLTNNNTNILIFTFFFLFYFFTYSQENILVKGSVFDKNNYEIPYAAVGIVKKYIGTSSTNEGTFSFIITTKELDDTLKISSIGFDTFKINVRDFINRNDKKIILKEKLTQLNEVIVVSPDNYVKTAMKKLKNNTISKNHQLKILYRRWSVEDNICRYYIEHFINAIDRGPSSYLSSFYVEHSRKSSEYRFIKNEQKIHALKYMELNNPLRKNIPFKDYNWKKINISSYDGEDIIIVEGKRSYLNERLRFYIGFDTSRIYKLEMSKVPKGGKAFEATYIYKKNKEGKLYLSYHNREWSGSIKFPENIRKRKEDMGEKVPNYVPLAYRHEVFVINLEENKNMFDYSGISGNMDMTLYKVPYDSVFWKNISLPPKTSFFKKNIKELESLYDVPIETQFKYSNRN